MKDSRIKKELQKRRRKQLYKEISLQLTVYTLLIIGLLASSVILIHIFDAQQILSTTL